MTRSLNAGTPSDTLSGLAVLGLLAEVACERRGVGPDRRRAPGRTSGGGARAGAPAWLSPAAAVDQLGLNSIALEIVNNEYGHGAGSIIKKTLEERGAELTAEASHGLADKDLSGQLSTLLGSNPGRHQLGAPE